MMTLIMIVACKCECLPPPPLLLQFRSMGWGRGALYASFWCGHKAKEN